MARTGKQTRALIIEVANELFGRHGFDHVTMKQIAGRLYITEAAVYKYFPTKESLCDAVLSSLAQRLECEPVFEQLAEIDDIERMLTDLARHIIAYFSRYPGIYRLLLYSALVKHSRAGGVYKMIRGTYSSFLKEQLDRLQKQKLIARVNSEITARCFVAMTFECALSGTLWKGMQGKVFAVDEIIKNNASIYARGLRIDKK